MCSLGIDIEHIEDCFVDPYENVVTGLTDEDAVRIVQNKLRRAVLQFEASQSCPARAIEV